MENFTIIKNQTKMSSSTPPPLSFHRDSQTISKAKPKIRIIHIYAPEIIKTDVANFRELVQRLTGKPPQQQKGCCKKKPRNNIARKNHGFSDKPVVSAKKVELRNGLRAGLETMERVKEEEEKGMWAGNINENSGGFLSGFGYLDGFIQEHGDFPLLPLDASHLMHGFQEAQLLA